VAFGGHSQLNLYMVISGEHKKRSDLYDENLFMGRPQLSIDSGSKGPRLSDKRSGRGASAIGWLESLD